MVYIHKLLFFSLISFVHSPYLSAHCVVDQNFIHKSELCCIDLENVKATCNLFVPPSINVPFHQVDKAIVMTPSAHSGFLNFNRQSSSCNLLCNTDFEDDKLVQAGNFGFFNQDQVSCWSTTATDQQIEIWGSGFGGVPAYSGNQFAELNANMVSTLYQNFSAALGSSVQISFAHRGRAGVDVMSVEIGPVGGPFQNLGQFSADRNAWVFHTLNYTFPTTGGTAYSIRFVSVSAAGGPTVGNFLDAISINLPKPSTSFTSILPNCPNDQNASISINVTGGSPPYSFKWYPPLNSVDSVVSGLSRGTYQVEIKDFYGCGEIHSFNLNSKHENDTIEISQKNCDFYKWDANGKIYQQSGKYTAVLQNVFGCDSIIKLDLEILKGEIVNESLKICDSYTWPVNGKTYTQTGIYADTLATISGCDSVMILNLQILPKLIQYNSLKLCNSYTWPVNGKLYTQSGIYSDTLTNSFGCDSILVLDLEISKIKKQYNTLQICNAYTWPVNGNRYTQSGIYTDTLTNSSGCDSIIILDLEILPINSQHNGVKICKAYTWPVNNQTYTQSGNYIDTLINAKGCDSIITLDLEILPAFQKFDNISECEKYYWPVNGQTYRQSGIYVDTLTNAFGCDSILNLNLKILPIYQKYDTIKFCDSYTWPVNGQAYKQSGNYSKKFQTQFGCDSVLNMNLTIHSSSMSKQTVSSCNKYTWPANGISYTKSGSYKLQTINNKGCDSTIILDLEIHPTYIFEDTVRVCDTYTWPVNGKTYTQSGTFTQNIQSSYTCDSIYFLQLNIDPSFAIYDTAIALEHYVWPVNQQLYEASGVYQEHFENAEGCDSLRVLFLVIKHKGNIYIPNVFTPNGDGINDKFIIYSSSEINRIDRLRIFDRWGELLFELSNFPPNDPLFGWDGNYRGQKMIPGVFVYTVEWTDLAGYKHIERGDMTLIR